MAAVGRHAHAHAHSMSPQLRHPLIHPFSGWDVNRLVDTQAARRPEHCFLIWEPFDGNTESWTYARFAEQTRRLAAGLAKRGIVPGDKVLIHLENCPETVLSWYACARLGAVALTTNARSSRPRARLLRRARRRGGGDYPAEVCCARRGALPERALDCGHRSRWRRAAVRDRVRV